MYRPTVRYDEVFRIYVDALFHATHLDRNQLIRAALFAAAHSKEFQGLLKPYQKGDVPLPSPPWSLEQNSFWREQCPKIKAEGEDVNADFTRTREAEKNNEDPSRPTPATGKQHRHIGPAARRERAVSSQSIKVSGGRISFTFN